MNYSSTKPTPARRRIGKAAALAFAVGLLTAVGAVSAHAATTPAHADFTAQAKRAGLSSAKAKLLQRQVNRYLALYHGKQIAANKIAAKGMYITLVLPGEKYARTLPTTSGMHTMDADTWSNMCDMSGSFGPPIGWFCLYSGQNFTGNVLSMYNCGDHYIYGWYGYGSWRNNQTPGQQAVLRSADWTSYYYTTPGAYSELSPQNWTPVDVVHPC